MFLNSIPDLRPSLTPGAQVTPTSKSGWHLEIPPGPGKRYRLAQLDDYAGLARKTFPWSPPATLSLRARAYAQEIPGTWGFGLWNDPFALSLGFGGATQLLPALPNATWFFFASPPNYLSVRDDLPARGALAAVFRSPPLPTALLVLGVLGLPFFLLPPTGRLLRRLARRFIHQDAAALSMDPTSWHDYMLNWQSDAVFFQVDGERVFETSISPDGPLGLVIWVDNQYAALPPSGRLVYGRLPNPEKAWIKVEGVAMQTRGN